MKKQRRTRSIWMSLLMAVLMVMLVIPARQTRAEGWVAWDWGDALEGWDLSAGEDEVSEAEALVEEDGIYTSKEEVAAYLHLYGHLPDNYITKKEAKKRGWVSSEGNLDKVAPGKSIGGDYFGNYEELLPVKKGRSYYECDIDYTGGRRNAKRIIYSDDGLIYYTEDHYKSFELLYTVQP